MVGGDDDGGNRSEADQLLVTSEKLLASSDFQEAKTYAIRACKSDPSKTHAADYILAISDTLLAGDSKPPNWYVILRLVPLTQNPQHISIQYRRLSLLLDPKVNRLPFVDQALKLVSDAWFVLSDPHKKAMNDQELLLDQTQNKTEILEGVVDTRFWTACPYCFVLFEYLKCYEGCVLRCECCERAFEAVRTKTPPVESDGKEGVYFWSWGLFPLWVSRYRRNFGWSPISQLCVCPTQRFDQEGGAKVQARNCWDDDDCVVISDDEMYVVISHDDG